MSANPSWPAPPTIQASPPTLVSEPPLSPGYQSAPAVPAEPVVEPVVEPDPVPFVPEPVHESRPAPPAYAPPEPLPAPTVTALPELLPEQPPLAALPQPAPPPAAPAPDPVPAMPARVAPTSYRVSIRLDDGDKVEVASHTDDASARAEATALMRYLRDGRGDWPFVGGRYLRPERIVSIDVDDA